MYAVQSSLITKYVFNLEKELSFLRVPSLKVRVYAISGKVQIEIIDPINCNWSSTDSNRLLSNIESWIEWMSRLTTTKKGNWRQLLRKFANYSAICKIDKVRPRQGPILSQI